jgi:flagellar hook-length control protein FliK
LVDDDIPASSDHSVDPANKPSKDATKNDALLDSLSTVTKQTADGPGSVDKKVASTPARPNVDLPTAKPAIADSKPSPHENVPAKPVLPAGESAVPGLQAHTSPQTVKEATAAVTSMGPRTIDTKPTALHAPTTHADASGKPQTSSVSVSSIHAKNGDGTKGQTSQSSRDNSSLGTSPSLDSTSDAGPGPQHSDTNFNSTLATHVATVTTQTQPSATAPSGKSSELLSATPQQVADAASAHITETTSAFAPAGIQAAKLVERMGQSEIRVGIRDGELGNVDIRTSMSHNNFTAQISVERGDLGRVIAAELPSLHSRLSDQRLPVTQITVQNESSGMSGNAGGGQQYSRSATSQSTFGGSSEAIMPFIAMDGMESSERLDIHM